MATRTRTAPADQRQLVAAGASKRQSIGHGSRRPSAAASTAMAKAVEYSPSLLRRDGAVTSRSTIFELAIGADAEYPHHETERPCHDSNCQRQRQQPKAGQCRRKTQNRQRDHPPAPRQTAAAQIDGQQGPARHTQRQPGDSNRDEMRRVTQIVSTRRSRELRRRSKRLLHRRQDDKQQPSVPPCAPTSPIATCSAGRTRSHCNQSVLGSGRSRRGCAPNPPLRGNSGNSMPSAVLGPHSSPLDYPRTSTSPRLRFQSVRHREMLSLGSGCSRRPAHSAAL